jgi:hypothetical protein
VKVIAARALLTDNAQLVDTAVVELTGNDAVGNGVGLPTAANQEAAALTPKDWARRQFVPTALIQPKQRDRSARAWQLVFGIKVLLPGQRATLQGVQVTFQQGGHTWRLNSQVHDVVETTGTSPSRC